jgi:hypothetical protein
MNVNGGADPPVVSLLTAPEIPEKGLRYSLELRLVPRTGLDVVAKFLSPGFEVGCLVLCQLRKWQFLIAALVVVLVNKQEEMYCPVPYKTNNRTS